MRASRADITGEGDPAPPALTGGSESPPAEGFPLSLVEREAYGDAVDEYVSHQNHKMIEMHNERKNGRVAKSWSRFSNQ